MADSLLPRNAWGGTVDPDKLAAAIVEKCSVELETAMAALMYTSKPRGRTRIFYQAYAEELLNEVKSVPADSSEVHILLAEGYTEESLVVRKAIAMHPHDLDAARAMLEAEAKK